MTVEDLIGQLRELPPLLHVDVRLPDGTWLDAASVRVERQNGVVVVLVENHDVTRRPRRRLFQRQIDVFRLGRETGYPLCCVVFFTVVFEPLQTLASWARGTPDHPARGFQEWLRRSLVWFLFRVWNTPKIHVLCPWHRVTLKPAP